MDRRDFLRLAGGAAATAVAGSALGCAGDGPSEASKAPKPPEEANSGGSSPRTLRIAQWGHYVPAYDPWFDGYALRWGEEHDVDKPIYDTWRERGKI